MPSSLAFLDILFFPDDFPDALHWPVPGAMDADTGVNADIIVLSAALMKRSFKVISRRWSLRMVLCFFIL